MPIIAKSSIKVQSGQVMEFITTSKWVLTGLSQKIKDPNSGIVGYGTSSKNACLRMGNTRQ